MERTLKIRSLKMVSKVLAETIYRRNENRISLHGTRPGSFTVQIPHNFTTILSHCLHIAGRYWHKRWGLYIYKKLKSKNSIIYRSQIRWSFWLQPPFTFYNCRSFRLLLAEWLTKNYIKGQQIHACVPKKLFNIKDRDFLHDVLLHPYLVTLSFYWF